MSVTENDNISTKVEIGFVVKIDFPKIENIHSNYGNLFKFSYIVW